MDAKHDRLSMGLFVLRLGIGLMFVSHGLPKLLAGPELWGQLGGAMALVGITFYPVFWGLMAGIAEAVGGLFLALGFFTRISATLLAFTMVIAALTHITNPEEGFKYASHAIEAGIVFVSFIIMGPGRYSLDAKLTSRQ